MSSQWSNLPIPMNTTSDHSGALRKWNWIEVAFQLDSGICHFGRTGWRWDIEK